MKYYIGDLHIGDESILIYEHRPFKNLLEMKNTIISNWNNIVNNDDDEVYLLGDIGDIEILEHLNGKIIIILGNHDDANKIKERYPEIELNIHPIMIGYTWLSHEPIGYMPPEIPYINIHAHTYKFNYGLLKRRWNDGNRYFCVSVEQIDCTPISEEKIKKILEI